MILSTKQRRTLFGYLFVTLLIFALAPSISAQRTDALGSRRAADSRKSTAPTRTFKNPVFDFDFPDPTVIRASDGWFYAYATNTNIGGRVYHIQAARSRDLVSWE